MSNTNDISPESVPPVQTRFELTGVPQLDLVLGGGIPQGALSIIVGPPGSGKTTLASQIAFAAAKRGKSVMLLTALSEPTTTLLSHLRSYNFFDATLIGSRVQVYSLKQFLPQGVAATSQEIMAAVRQTNAQLVVLDGFQSIRSIEPDFEAARRLLYDLGARMSLRGTTTLITTEADPHDPGLFPEMTTADVLIGLYFKSVGMRTFRHLEVIKVRGRAPLIGQHSLSLTDDGMHIFPRLETLVVPKFREDWSVEGNDAQLTQRADFGFAELDALLGGGLTRGTSTLLAGSLGSGKTLIALHFALHGVSQGEPTLFLSFRETGAQLIQKANSFSLGEQIRAALAPNGGLSLQRWEPVELDPDQVAMRLLSAIDQIGAKRVVIDSIVELERAVSEINGRERSSNYLAALLAVLRERGVTLLALKETPKSLTTQLDFSADALSILAENVVFLQHIAYRGMLHNVLSVLKMRFSSHDYMLREFQIVSPEGLSVLTPDESGQEVMLGLIEQQGVLSLPHAITKTRLSPER
jgi:circadian clock protein KaiC